MKIGTRSILFGVHQFVLHPVMVVWAWRILYRQWPRLHEWCAIVTHDWGYWGLNDMDGEEGERHPIIISLLWDRLFKRFGKKVAIEIMGHSRFWAGKAGTPLSRLFNADKLAMALYPRWFYLLLGSLSGEIREYMAHSETANGKYTDVIKAGKGKVQWVIEAQAHMALMGLHGGDYGTVKRQMAEAYSDG